MPHSKESSAGEEEEEERVLERLADCLYVHFQKVPLLEERDPFESYMHQLRAGWYKDHSLFLQRFLNGYRLIKSSQGEKTSSGS